MHWKNYTVPFLGVIVLLAIGASEYLTTPRPTKDRIHITYWEKWTEFEGDAMNAVVDAYNKSQDKIQVDVLTVSGIENKTLLAIAGGNPPDCAGLYGPNVAQYADDNAVIPLDDFCREKGISGDQYIPVYWDIVNYHNHIYALPTAPASTALHYNKKMFRDAGLDPEKPPQTIEEMNEMADKIVTRTASGRIDKAGFLPAEPGWWNFGWGCVFGGKLWDGHEKLTANSEDNIRAFEWVQYWPQKYGKDDLQTFKSGFGNFSSPQNAFLSEKVAMELQGVWMYNFINMYAPKMEKPQRDWAAVPFPHPANRPDLAGVTFADEDVLVSHAARNIQKRRLSFAFVQSQKGMELLCMGQRKHSPLLNVSDEFWKNHPNPYVKLFADAPKGKNVVQPPKIGIWPEYKAELDSAFEEIALLKRTPRQALDHVQERMQPKFTAYLQRLRARGETE